MVFDVFSLDVDIVLDDVCENLRELGAGDVVLRRKNFSSAVNVIRTDHRSHIRQRPVGNLAAVRERGQVCFCVSVIIQLQRSRHNRHSLLPGDGSIWRHARIASTVVGSHLDGEGNIIVVPLGFRHILILRNVRLLVAAKRAVDDCGHLRARHVAVWIDDCAGFSVKQTIVHGGADRFCIPCSTVIVLEICSLASGCACRRRGNCQR